MDKHKDHGEQDTEKKVKDAKGLRGRAVAFADAVIANLRTADSVEDLNRMLDDFETNKARAINDLVAHAKD